MFVFARTPTGYPSVMVYIISSHPCGWSYSSHLLLWVLLGRLGNSPVWKVKGTGKSNPESRSWVVVAYIVSILCPVAWVSDLCLSVTLAMSLLLGDAAFPCGSSVWCCLPPPPPWSGVAVFFSCFN